MKYLALCIALFAATSVTAGEFAVKDEPSKAKGSSVGFFSSNATGNGHVVGQGEGAPDQTTYPGSRADAVQAIHASEGRGRDK